jgi:hypothetical protein
MEFNIVELFEPLKLTTTEWSFFISGVIVYSITLAWALTKNANKDKK